MEPGKTAVEVELLRILISETSDHQMIVLKEKRGSRSFSVMIGTFEADAIRRGVSDLRPPRPLTHDLLSNVLDHLGVELAGIVVSDMRNHTYYGKLLLRRGEEVLEVDSRPSDAIALAVTRNAPMYVEERVLDEACKAEPLV